MTVNKIWRKHGINSGTSYKWKAKYGGLEASELKRIRELKREVVKLEQMYAELALENRALTKSAIRIVRRPICERGVKHDTDENLGLHWNSYALLRSI